MGATGKYKSVSPWALDRLKDHPWLVEVFVSWRYRDLVVDPDFDDKLDVVRQLLAPELRFPQDRRDIALRIYEHRNPAAVAVVRPHLERLRSEWDRPGLDIDKAWRWLLEEVSDCGADVAELCARAVRGGTPLGPDLGYGPASFHGTTAVATLAASLPEAVSRYTAAGGEYVPQLEAVRDYYAAAAQGGEAMLVYLS